MNTVDRGSVIASLKANRDRLLNDKELTLKVPGWDSLHVTYKRLPWERVQKLSSLGSGDATQDIGAAIDVLIAACVEFTFDDGETRQALGVRYEQALAELIGDSESTSPPEVVLSVFAEDETSLMVHAGEFMEWAMRLNHEADEELGKD